MCGINGVWCHGEGEDMARKVQKMNSAILHRGPDSSGIWENYNGSMVLGHQRLAILDLSNDGDQPIDNEDIVLVYNGELYNCNSLKGFISDKNYSSTCDTEVLEKILLQEGMGALSKLNGMFAFALYKKHDDKLYLVRDRLGIKPLYYFSYGSFFAFSSELTALSTLDEFIPDVEDEAIENYMTSNRQSGNKTVYKYVKKVPPGCYVEVSHGGEIKVNRYWSLARDKLVSRMTEDEVSNLLLEKLSCAVSGQMQSDVPIGCFLSGGVDSSAIVALMRRHSRDSIDTFSIGFEGAEDFTEIEYAEKVARQFNTDHKTVMVNKESLIESLPNMVEIFDDPLADPTSIPIHYLSQEAKTKGTKVILTGDGADEIFYGYKSWAKYKKVEGITNLLLRVSFIPRVLLKMVDVSGAKGSRLGEYLRRVNAGLGAYAPGDGGIKPNVVRDISRMLSGDRPVAYIQNAVELMDGYIGSGFEREDSVSWMCYSSLMDVHPNYFLYRMDKITSSHSIEARVPFLDHELVQFGMNIPSRLKYKNGIPKYILKKSMEPIVDKNILYRKKMGFCVPVDDWLGEVIPSLVEKNLVDSQSIMPIFNVPETLRYLKRARGQRRESTVIWNIYFIVQWIIRWGELHEKNDGNN
ncbi:asparagine synthase (glutamine-hydrolyzing) [uncultured Pseudoteredinibacter sp.]|uniref:asparagine synthase (glutamine-hydrolyzing) n=1 Tax=uncultured Pseudoteredinibacter sp. TaxID=1641701 RepID=UPI002633FEC8|nr:asparagine synthase (glutamine-hydrolyzing) [uncultured Pseudoteredinibacter sp.]